MRYKSMTIMWAMMALAVLSAGCNSIESHRKASASHRWEQKLDAVRLQAAQESIERGQLAYAEQVLKTCAESDIHGQQARQMLAQVQLANRQFAKARQEQQSDEEQVY